MALLFEGVIPSSRGWALQLALGLGEHEDGDGLFRRRLRQVKHLHLSLRFGWNNQVSMV